MREEDPVMLKLLVVEDHAMVREGLLQALHGLEPDVVALGAADADAALTILAGSDDVDMVLLDLMLPGTSGMALLGVLRKRFPAIPVVVLSALDDADTVSRALRQGASGFVPKSSSTESMLDALREVLAGEIYLPPKLRDPAARNTGRGKDVARRYGLTQGQMRVLELLIQGKTNRQIAELLAVTEGTVKIHVSAIFKAMNVANRSQALLLAKKQHVRI
jgi:DNA-binding NarL/FixJ family response regulator